MSTIAVHPTYAAPRRAALPAHSHMRLTRRGRLVVLLACLGLVLSVAFLYGGSSVATDTPEPTRTITVGQGETLWGIASELATNGEVRPMMHRIQKMNGLDSGMLLAGQELLIPVA